MPEATVDVAEDATPDAAADAAADAAEKYFAQRKLYRNALDKTKSIAEKDVRTFAQDALLAYVRRGFRGISDQLTKRIGCHLTCIPDGFEGKPEIEHAVPVNLIHNRILGIKGERGVLDTDTHDVFPTVESIQAYVEVFMVGVWVTKDQHRQLKGHSMHGEWTWLADMPPWSWDELAAGGWEYEERPLWLQRIMGRYEAVPIPYRPTMPVERWKEKKKKKNSRGE